ncbi:hypothetical protein FisN_2Lu440 [Fistulifera solaris]|uniref:Uncharacterized protein n=1 Tax=Fistulifera solaris TaxID=1519565 RepID=A0A1Z5JPF8_FISSO|nr:hypothetical protein FisN_2Lu440 [Fistulifera solaris]|eukprot:GAX15849.1 hypothetical protein FisN_2Lu440 [Fistulifera solaris]
MFTRKESRRRTFWLTWIIGVERTIRHRCGFSIHSLNTASATPSISDNAATTETPLKEAYSKRYAVTTESPRQKPTVWYEAELCHGLPKGIEPSAKTKLATNFTTIQFGTR